MPVPYSFGAATSAIPLSQLDANFNTPITLGNTAIQLGNTVTTLNNMTLANVTISSGNVTITNVTVTTANATTVNTTTLIATTANVTTGNVTNLISGNVSLTGGSITGTPISGSTGSFTTLTTSGTVTLNGGVANGVAYLDGSKVLTTGSALTFDGTNLGIGTSSPTQPLSIRNAGSAYLDVAGGSRTLGTNSFTFGQASDGVVAFFQRENAAMYWAINSSEQMRLTSTGLGIGTSSPAAKLHIAGTGSQQALVQSTNGGQTSLQLLGSGVSSRVVKNVSGALVFEKDAVDQATIDSSGNLGLGVTPSAWATVYKALQVGSVTSLFTGGSGSYAGNNWYSNSSDVPIYLTTNGASYYRQIAGSHAWFTAPSGTAGNAISFTQAMTLDASGNLGVGTTSPQLKLVVSNSGAQGFEVNPASTSISGGVDLLAYNRSTSAYAPINFDGSYHVFSTSNTERARITSGGDLLVGTTSGNDGRIKVDGTGNGTNCAVWAKSSGGATGPTHVTWNSATSGDNKFFDFYTEATATIRGSIDYNRAGGQVRYNTTSDYRAKEVYGPVQNSGEQIDALKVYRGKMLGATQERPMMIAHEAQKVVPYAVGGEKDIVNEDGTPKYQTMDHQILVPLLIAELQSLRARVAQLESKGA